VESERSIAALPKREQWQHAKLRIIGHSLASLQGWNDPLKKLFEFPMQKACTLIYTQVGCDPTLHIESALDSTINDELSISFAKEQ
jgi:hypothetical protein